jgi:hypothetical protein
MSDPGEGAGAGAAGEALFILPDELAIDTDVARKVIGAFIRSQLRQAEIGRAHV